jgi:MFS transporter, CP family, cyanate transporter
VDHDVALADGMAADELSGRRLASLLFVTGITALAFNLRPAITSLPPVFPELASRLGLSSAALTALATIPVVCFGVFSGVAPRLSRRFGDERALFVALIVVTVGLALRGGFPEVALFPATVLAAAAIAIMNVLLPGLIKRRMPERAGLLIGIYLLSLSVGAIIGSLISVPVYRGSGGSAQLVLGLWAIPAAVCAAMWLPQLRRRKPATSLVIAEAGLGGRAPGGESTAARGESTVARGESTAARGESTAARGRQSREADVKSSAGHAVHRHLLGWQVAGFMGLQSLTYYATLSWLPSLFRDRGASPAQAGVLISVAALGGAMTSLVVPVLAHRATDQRLLVIPTVLVSGIGIAAALFAPMGMATFWMFVLGLGQGAALGLAIFFTMARAATPAIAASLSSLAQSAGYLLASTGPLLVGFLHTATGSWTVPIFLLLGFTAIELFAGYLAARARVIA